MVDAKAKEFHFRAMVSVLTAVSFMVLALTGLVLFITPPGRIANWTGWQFGGLTKHQWGSQHIWFATIFLLASMLHVYLNWKPLLNYFKGRVTRRISLRMDWIIAIVICLAVFAGTLIELPPFTSLIALNEEIKNSWDENEQSAPIPHAELLTLRELAAETNVDLDQLLSNLKSKGIDGASADEVVGDLANSNDMTPHALFVLATGKQPVARLAGRGAGGDGAGGDGAGGDGVGGDGVGGGGGRSAGGMGMGGPGRKSIERLCADEGLDLEAVLQHLHDNNIAAEAEMILRDVAIGNGIKPLELLDMIRDE